MSHWEAQVGATDEWYTPRYIFDALGCDFDLDVAHPPTGTSCLHAEHLFAGGSLESEWFGFVWANFPFGGRNGLAPWLAKFFDHGNGIGLTPDRTSAPWFRQAWARADLALFMPKVRFLRPDGTQGKSPSTGTTLWAAGERAEAALVRAARHGLGFLAEPVRITSDSGSGLCSRPGTGLDPEGRRAAAPQAPHRPEATDFPQLSMFMEAAE